MLLVKTQLKNSRIHGVGIFADEDIRKGTAIWRIYEGFDLEYSVEAVDKLPTAAREQVISRSYTSMDTGKLVMCGDDARFMNHSSHPNTKNGDKWTTIAVRDISRGEELTCDYYEFDADAGRHF